jgi:hypothetical protein
MHGKATQVHGETTQGKDSAIQSEILRYTGKGRQVWQESMERDKVAVGGMGRYWVTIAKVALTHPRGW